MPWTSFWCLLRFTTLFPHFEHLLGTRLWVGCSWTEVFSPFCPTSGLLEASMLWIKQQRHYEKQLSSSGILTTFNEYLKALEGAPIYHYADNVRVWVVSLSVNQWPVTCDLCFVLADLKHFQYTYTQRKSAFFKRFRNVSFNTRKCSMAFVLNLPKSALSGTI